jgi:pyridoxal 5'-phosphate synthase pdxT subunit
MTETIGVLALQGAFAEHIQMLKQLGLPAREVRTRVDLDASVALIIPGGESTTIGKLLRITGLDEAIRARADAGLPIWGTCAGMILLGRDVGDSGSKVGEPQPLLGLMDIRVRRNAFGSQLESFETHLDAPEIADYAIPAVFIRAPVVESTGPEVTLLATLKDGRPVAVRQGQFLATAFHPELTGDLAFHRYFARMAAASLQHA